MSDNLDLRVWKGERLSLQLSREHTSWFGTVTKYDLWPQGGVMDRDEPRIHASVGIKDTERGREMKLIKIFARPRRRGFGRLMIDEIKQFAADRNCTLIWGEASADEGMTDPELRAFYRANNFEFRSDGLFEYVLPREQDPTRTLESA